MKNTAALSERQLEIMRESYPGFREKDEAVRRIREDQLRYKREIGYIPRYAERDLMSKTDEAKKVFDEAVKKLTPLATQENKIGFFFGFFTTNEKGQETDMYHSCPLSFIEFLVGELMQNEDSRQAVLRGIFISAVGVLDDVEGHA